MLGTPSASRTAIAACLAFALAASCPAEARNKKKHQRIIHSPRWEQSYYVRGENGQVVAESRADEKRYPASLTKLMTLLLLFEELERTKAENLKDGLTLASLLPVSDYAASKERTNLKLRAGSSLSVEDAILGLIICSANDAAVAVAEALKGSEAAFAELMTKRAQQIGMNNTVFRNASGLPDRQQVTTARDMVTLAMYIWDKFKVYRPYFSRTKFMFNGERYNTHNGLIRGYGGAGAEGLKTGYIRDSGFNLTGVFSRAGQRVFGAIMGQNSASLAVHGLKRWFDTFFRQTPSGIANVTPSGPPPKLARD